MADHKDRYEPGRRTLGEAIGAPNRVTVPVKVHILRAVPGGRNRTALCGLLLRKTFTEGIHLCPPPSCAKCLREAKRDGS